MPYLNDPRVRDWWEMYRQARGYDYPQWCTNVLGYYRIFVREIPNELCYRYLEACGYYANGSGEILLSEQEAIAYNEFQQMMNETSNAKN